MIENLHDVPQRFRTLCKKEIFDGAAINLEAVGCRQHIDEIDRIFPDKRKIARTILDKKGNNFEDHKHEKKKNNAKNGPKQKSFWEEGKPSIDVVGKYIGKKIQEKKIHEKRDQVSKREKKDNGEKYSVSENIPSNETGKR